MKTKRIVAKNIETAYASNPEWMAVIAGSDDESVEVVFETMKAPGLAASILLSSQDAAKTIDPAKIAKEMEWNLDTSMQILPEALDIKTLAGGEVLCINVGSGVLFFKLTPPAKRSLNNPGGNLGG